MSKEKLDKNKPYSKIRGDKVARFRQDKNLYDFYGNKCGEVPEAFVTKKKSAADKPAPAPAKTRQEAALARAADKLGDLGVATAPMGLADARKENAKALAAEEKAE